MMMSNDVADILIPERLPKKRKRKKNKCKVKILKLLNKEKGYDGILRRIS